jgi:hypothetical protein
MAQGGPNENTEQPGCHHIVRRRLRAGAQINIPNPTLPGGSYESAVRLVVTNEMMLDHQIKRWIHALRGPIRMNSRTSVKSVCGGVHHPP